MELLSGATTRKVKNREDFDIFSEVQQPLATALFLYFIYVSYLCYLVFLLLTFL